MTFALANQRSGGFYSGSSSPVASAVTHARAVGPSTRVNPRAPLPLQYRLPMPTFLRALCISLILISSMGIALWSAWYNDGNNWDNPSKVRAMMSSVVSCVLTTATSRHPTPNTQHQTRPTTAKQDLPAATYRRESPPATHSLPPTPRGRCAWQERYMMNSKMCCIEPVDMLTYLGYDPDDQGSNQTLLDALNTQAFAPAEAYNASGWTTGTLGNGVLGTGALADAEVAVAWAGRDGCVAVPEQVRNGV